MSGAVFFVIFPSFAVLFFVAHGLLSLEQAVQRPGALVLQSYPSPSSSGTSVDKEKMRDKEETQQITGVPPMVCHEFPVPWAKHS